MASHDQQPGITQAHSFRRSVQSLPAIAEFVSRFFDRTDVHGSILSAVQLSVEELFSNMVKYNPDGPESIFLRLTATNGGVRVALTDHEKEPFDVTRVSAADTSLPIEERPIGKLGIHLVREIVDKLEFEHDDGRSTITFTKHPG